MALVDCVGRTHTALVDESASIFFIGSGWNDFLLHLGAATGDFLLFKFKSARTCKVLLFNAPYGWQKYPAFDQQDQDRVPMPRVPSKYMFIQPPTTARRTFWLTAGERVCAGANSGSPVYNATGRGMVVTMTDFVEHLAQTYPLQVPLYYCKLGILELECGVLVGSGNIFLSF